MISSTSENVPPVVQPKKGRPKKYTDAERLARLNDYIKNVYYPQHKEEYRERSRQYYQRTKAKSNSKQVVAWKRELYWFIRSYCCRTPTTTLKRRWVHSKQVVAEKRILFLFVLARRWIPKRRFLLKVEKVTPLSKIVQWWHFLSKVVERSLCSMQNRDDTSCRKL